VFENRVLRTMFGPKSDEVGGHWRRLRKEELHDMYPSLNIVQVIKSNETGGSCRTCRGEQSCILGFRCLAKNPEEKRLRRRPGCRWEDNYKTDLSRIGIGTWIALISFRIGTGGALL